MKIKRRNFNIFYKHILNPFAWILICIVTIHWLTLSWWSRKREDEYYNYSTDKEEFKRMGVRLIITFIEMVINSVWHNEKLTCAYGDYLERKWFPYYPIGDWRRQKNIEERYKYYENVKNGKFK